MQDTLKIWYMPRAKRAENYVGKTPARTMLFSIGTVGMRYLIPGVMALSALTGAAR